VTFLCFWKCAPSSAPPPLNQSWRVIKIFLNAGLQHLQQYPYLYVIQPLYFFLLPYCDTKDPNFGFVQPVTLSLRFGPTKFGNVLNEIMLL
jgi:hypothetical protein